MTKLLHECRLYQLAHGMVHVSLYFISRNVHLTDPFVVLYCRDLRIYLFVYNACYTQQVIMNAASLISRTMMLEQWTPLLIVFSTVPPNITSCIW